MRTAHGIYRSCRGAVKSWLGFHDFYGDEITYMYQQTHCSRYTNTKGRQAISETVSLQGLREINLRVNIRSEFIKNHVTPKELSTALSILQLDKKHLQKRHCIFRRDREPSRIPARTQNI